MGKILVAALMAFVVIALLIASLQKEEIPARNYSIMRILLSAAMGVVGGVIPGFLRISLTFNQVGALRAGGGLGLAAMTYFFTPGIVPNDPPKPQAPAPEVAPVREVRLRVLSNGQLVRKPFTAKYRSGEESLRDAIGAAGEAILTVPAAAKVVEILVLSMPCYARQSEEPIAITQGQDIAVNVVAVPSPVPPPLDPDAFPDVENVIMNFKADKARGAAVVGKGKLPPHGQRA